jgi:MFS family permease
MLTRCPACAQWYEADDLARASDGDPGALADRCPTDGTVVRVPYGRRGASKDPTQPHPDAPVGDGVVLIVVLVAVVVAALVAAVVVGVLTFNVLVFLGAAVGGVVFGVLWLFGIGGISDWAIDRGLRELALSVGLFGAPVVAVAVAVAVGAGYGWAVAIAVVPALFAGAGLWLLHRLLDRRRRPG